MIIEFRETLSLDTFQKGGYPLREEWFYLMEEEAIGHYHWPDHVIWTHQLQDLILLSGLVVSLANCPTDIIVRFPVRQDYFFGPDGNLYRVDRRGDDLDIIRLPEYREHRSRAIVK